MAKVINLENPARLAPRPPVEISFKSSLGDGVKGGSFSTDHSIRILQIFKFFIICSCLETN